MAKTNITQTYLKTKSILLDHIIKWSIIEIGVIISVLFFFNVSWPTRESLALWIFAESYTFILIAAITLPRFAQSLSRSVITRRLLVQSNLFNLLLFISYQVFISIYSLLVHVTKPPCDNSTLYSRLMILLAIFNLFYITWYIIDISMKVNNPGKEFNDYVDKRFKKYLRKYDSDKKLDKYSKKVEKLLILITELSQGVNENYERIIIIESVADILNILKSVKNTSLKDLFPSNPQFKVIESLHNSLIQNSSNDQHPADDICVSKTLELIYSEWQYTINWTNHNNDFELFARCIGQLGRYSIYHYYRNSSNKAIKLLGLMMDDCINDYKQQYKIRLMSSLIAYQLLTIGKSAHKNNRNKYLILCFNKLLYFAKNAPQEQCIILYYSLILAEEIYSNDYFTLSYLKKCLESKELKNLYFEASYYGMSYDLIETSRILEFLKILGK